MRKEYADVHCHILPGVDDGARDEETSLQMIDIAYEEGARIIVLTPHYEVASNRYEPQELNKIFVKLDKKMTEKYSDLRLYLGNEVLLAEGVLDCLRDNQIHTMNQTKYVLVEFNVRIAYHELYQLVKAITQARYRPIIAHVERYSCLTKHMTRIDELTELGVYLQMNAESVIGSIFDDKIRWCRKLMKEHKIQFLGSDAHDLEERAPHMRETVEWMYKKLDSDYVEEVIWNNPKRMLDNQYLV